MFAHILIFTHSLHYAFYRYGSHYWLFDVDMDCSRTEGGWFEFKAVFTKSGSDFQWEKNVAQAQSCVGELGQKTRFARINHVGKCGAVNVVHFNSGYCRIGE